MAKTGKIDKEVTFIAEGILDIQDKIISCAISMLCYKITSYYCVYLCTGIHTLTVMAML